MSLFKRIFPSLFPPHFGVSTLWPVNVFLWLINPKHFFTVIVKRMVENPKLNFFDIGLDAIETKIGFGNEANIKPKDLDLYFSYCIAANLNGYKFYSLTSTIWVVSIALSQYFIADFPRNKNGIDQYMVLLITINIVGYVFAARVKIFPPNMSIEESFNRFITVFFNIYDFLLKLYSVHLTLDERTSIKNTLMQHVDIFFCLYDIYNLYNVFLVTPYGSDSDQIERLLKQEVKKKSSQVKLNEFFASYHTYKYDSALYGFEDLLFDMIMPAEIMIKLLYNRQDVFLISEHLVPCIYKKQDLDLFIQGSLQRKSGIAQHIIEYLMDHKHRKEHFFEAVKHMIMYHHSPSSSNADMLEDLLSSISDGGSWFIPFPNDLMKEGMLMDRMLNFYVGLMGSFRIARGDSFYIRYMKPGLLHFVDALELSSKTSLNYSNTLLQMWNKNAFFYKTIFDGIRSGKHSFIIPFVADTKETYQYKYVLDQMMIGAISTIYQDILVKDIRLSIHQSSITSKMKKLHGKEILVMIWLNTVSFLQQYYYSIDTLLTKPYFSSTALTDYNDEDIKSLKDSLYSLEYRMVDDFLQLLEASHVLVDFDDGVVIHIVSILKDTMVGLLFLMHMLFMKEKEHLWAWSLSIDHLLTIFVKDILLITPSLIVDQIITCLHQLYYVYSPLIEWWTKIDDNQYFIDVGVDCWSIFINKNNDHNRSISIEDALRFRGYLKHITYYNKRYVIPKI